MLGQDGKLRKEKPDLTFCIPSFGPATFLLETLESIRKQSKDCLAIVCFGGAPAADIREYCDRHDWVSLITLDPDPGMVHCWSRAAEACQTRFLSFLADDNMVSETYAETMTHYLDSHPETEFVFCNQSYVNEQGEDDTEKTDETNNHFGRNLLKEGSLGSEDTEVLIMRNAIPLEASVYRHELWQEHGPFSADSFGAFDLEFNYRLLLKGAKVAFIKQALVRFRWHDDAYSNRARQEHLRGLIHALETLTPIAEGSVKAGLEQRKKNTQCRLLRFPMSFPTRFAISLRLARGGMLLEVLKQNLARVLKRQ